MAGTTPAQQDLMAVKNYFGMELADLKTEWAKGGLTKEAKAEIAGGIRDGSLTYPARQAEPEGA